MPEGELLAPLAILRYEDSKLDCMIDPDLWKNKWTHNHSTSSQKQHITV